MKKLRQLTPQDVLFVGGETAKMYQHTAGLVLLDSSGRPDFGFEAFRRHIEERVGGVPQFRWKLHEVPLGLDLPYWVEDEHFNFDHHIRRIAVSPPGDPQALGELVAYLYSKHLDRNRPLWEMWFIEGVADGQYAVLQKMHHCMMDGEAARKLGEMIGDFEPDAPPKAIEPAIAEARAGEVPEWWRKSFNAAARLSRLPLQASREVYDAARQSVWQRITRIGKPAREMQLAPVACFNAEIGGSRGFVFGSLPLADIKTVKDHFGVTVNDVVLALVGSSLRDYLLRQGKLPDDSLRAYIAISLRAENDDTFSNKVTSTDVTLGTAIAEPEQRLRSIAAETAAAKKLARGGGNKGLMEILGLFPPVVVNAMVSLAPVSMIMRASNGNLLVSNVRGSPRAMYLGGARIAATYPMSIVTPGMGINVTCVSCVDNVDFGVTIAPELIPEPWLVIGGLHKALGDYLAMTRKKARRANRATVDRIRSKAERTAGRTKPDPKRARARKKARN